MWNRINEENLDYESAEEEVQFLRHLLHLIRLRVEELTRFLLTRN